MILNFGASDDLKILQAEVISEFEGLLNVSMRMRLTILFLNMFVLVDSIVSILFLSLSSFES